MIKAYSDAAYWSPFKAGIGVVIRGVMIENEENHFYFYKEELNLPSSTAAEYKATGFGLKSLINLNLCQQKIIFYTDQQVLVRQINGQLFLPKNEYLCRCFCEILYLLRYFSNCKVKHIKGMNPAHNIAHLTFNKVFRSKQDKCFLI